MHGRQNRQSSGLLYLLAADWRRPQGNEQKRKRRLALDGNSDPVFHGANPVKARLRQESAEPVENSRSKVFVYRLFPQGYEFRRFRVQGMPLCAQLGTSWQLYLYTQRANCDSYRFFHRNFTPVFWRDKNRVETAGRNSRHRAKASDTGPLQSVAGETK